MEDKTRKAVSVAVFTDINPIPIFTRLREVLIEEFKIKEGNIDFHTRTIFFKDRGIYKERDYNGN